MFVQPRKGLALFLVGIIAAAGCTIWDAGPGETLRTVQRNSRAQADMHQLGIAALEYAQDHHMTYPDAANWEQKLRPYLGKAVPDFTLPAVRNQKPHRIAINSNIAGHKMEDLLALSSAVLFFESTVFRPNAADPLTSLPDTGSSIAIEYADGHGYVYPITWREGIQEGHFHREALGEFVRPALAKK